MTHQILKSEYGKSTEHEVKNDMAIIIKPVWEINCGFDTIDSAIATGNINCICDAVKVLVQALHLPVNDFQDLESYIRNSWKNSPRDCAQALRHACMDRRESDIGIRSTQEAALSQGTHFIDVVAKDGSNQRAIVFEENGLTDKTETTGKPLRVKVTVGPEETIRVNSEQQRLVIFSVLHGPRQTNIKTQRGDPVHARYLEADQDTFMAGNHFSADLMGDPSWYELKLTPNSSQEGHEHVHPHTRLVYVTQGKGVLETGITSACAEQRFELHPGMVVVLTPGSWHRFSTGSTGLTVQPVHPVTPTSGASTNSHPMFFGTLKNATDIKEIIQRGGTL